jgi:hypothetical protein
MKITISDSHWNANSSQRSGSNNKINNVVCTKFMQIFYCEKIMINVSGLKDIPKLYFRASTNATFFHTPFFPNTLSDLQVIVGSDLGCSLYSLVYGY